MLRDAIRKIETLRAGAEEYKESRSEKWAESALGEAYENRIERLGEVIATLNDAFDDFVDITEGV